MKYFKRICSKNPKYYKRESIQQLPTDEVVTYIRKVCDDGIYVWHNGRWKDSAYCDERVLKTYYNEISEEEAFLEIL